MPKQNDHSSGVRGQVQFTCELDEEHTNSITCHYHSCRILSGYFVVAVHCLLTDLNFIIKRGVKWYRSSSFAKRSFCEEKGDHYEIDPNEITR